MVMILADPAGISFVEELHTKSGMYDQQGSCWNRQPAVETVKQARKRGRLQFMGRKMWEFGVIGSSV